MNPLQKAIEHFGTQAALARALGIVPMAITNWKVRGIPVEQCAAIERATGGAVTRAELRPDIFGEPTARPKRGAAA